MTTDKTAELPTPEIEEAAQLLRTAGWLVTPPAEVRYGCFADLFAMDPGTEPDGCVIDNGDRDSCIYANGPGRVECKEQCKNWKAWTPATLSAYWKGFSDGE